jgi:hypothetical protein
VSEDGRYVVLAGRPGAKTGGFRVSLDVRLAAALRGELTEGEDAPGSDLTPRDIQARLRAGESAEDIAQAAGVPLPRVLRFSGPVQAEMARVIEEARACYLVRGRLGQSVVVLGEAVDDALVAGGADLETAEGTTRRDEDGTWVVRDEWTARARARAASWRYDPAARTIAANDPASAALGHRDSETPVAPRRKALPPPPKPPKPRKAAAAKPTAKKAAKKAAKAAPKPAAKPAATKAAKKVVKKAAKKTVTRATKASTAKPRSRALSVVPDPPARARSTKPAATRAAKKAAPKGGKASVPGWADVLLSTAPGTDR